LQRLRCTQIDGRGSSARSARRQKEVTPDAPKSAETRPRARGSRARGANEKAAKLGGLFGSTITVISFSPLAPLNGLSSDNAEHSQRKMI
jgi:hypothetical protein